MAYYLLERQHMRVRGLFATLAVIAAAAACSSSKDDGDAQESNLTGKSTRTLAPEEDVSVLVEHPETLEALEALGFDLGSRLTGAPLADGRAFSTSAPGAAILAAVEADVAVAKKVNGGMPTFDPKWLRSKET